MASVKVGIFMYYCTNMTEKWVEIFGAIYKGYEVDGSKVSALLIVECSVDARSLLLEETALFTGYFDWQMASCTGQKIYH